MDVSISYNNFHFGSNKIFKTVQRVYFGFYTGNNKNNVIPTLGNTESLTNKSLRETENVYW